MTVTSVQSAPASAALSAVGMADPETVLSAVMLEIQDCQLGQAQRNAQDADSKRSLALEKAHKALRDAMEAEKKSGFFAHLAAKYGGVATVAAAVAVTAGTAGAGAPAGLALLAAGCSAGSYAMKATGLDAKAFRVAGVDIHLSDLVALAGMAAGVGSAAGAAGAGSKAATATAAQKACVYVEQTAQATQSVATAARAVTHYQAKSYEADATDDSARAKEANADAERAKGELEEQIGGMSGIVESRKRMMDVVDSILKQRHATQRALTEIRA
jgi:hypothetical protein